MMIEFGKKLRMLMAEAGVNPASLAVDLSATGCKVTTPTVRGWCNGGRSPSDFHVVIPAIVRVLAPLVGRSCDQVHAELLACDYGDGKGTNENYSLGGK